eukprot:Gb_21564 [translate_table: standard]
MADWNGAQHGQMQRPLKEWASALYLRLIIAVLISLSFAGVSWEKKECWASDRAALLAFKSGVIDHGGRLVSWQGAHCCEWVGVECEKGSRGRVISLDLSNPHVKEPARWSLNGITPDAAANLFQLEELQHLDLSFNNFSGAQLPPSIGCLQSLRYLNLSNAGFGGNIPRQLGNLTKMEYLDHLSMDNTNLSLAAKTNSWAQHIGRLSNLENLSLSNCDVAGTLLPSSLLNLTRLAFLQLDGNKFFSEMPTWLGNLTNLAFLQLSNASLHGPVPLSLSQLPRLKIVMLGYNDLSGDISEILHGPWPSLTYLRMMKAKIYGFIPPSVANHSSQLVYLRLDENHIEGKIPSTIGNLSQLYYLNLGTIPLSLGRLTQLSDLRLYSNLLEGPIPLSFVNLSSLTYLDLKSNKLSASIPSSFGRLSLLTHLDLSHNELNEIVPDSLGDFRLTLSINPAWIPSFQLERLLLGGCNMGGVGVPSFLSTQYRLGSIDLSNNSLTGSIPAWLWELPSLNTITLKHNQFQGQFPAGLYSTSASYVDLRDNWLNGPILLPHSNASATFPAFLELSMNSFSGVIPFTISQMIGTSTSLYLSNNKLVGAIPSFICDNASLLRVLDLSYNNISGKIPSTFGKCISIQVLNLARNKLEGEIPEEIGNLKGLQLLHTSDNALKGSIPSSLEGCKQLESLDLRSNALSGTITKWIGGFSRLQVLVLSFNNFHGNIPSEICYLSRLHVLDLSNNNLTGIIPMNLRLLQSMAQQNDYGGAVLKFVTHFTEGLFLTTKGNTRWYKHIFRMFCLIDLSSNRLSGGIPEDIGELKGLHSLNLSKNYLRGVIPEKVGDLVNLESLDLSWNNLSGRIPTSLAVLTFLANFNVSQNNLSGHIPPRLRRMVGFLMVLPRARELHQMKMMMMKKKNSIGVTLLWGWDVLLVLGV